MKEKLAVLCKEIGMPPEATQEILEIAPTLELEKLNSHMEGLFTESKWEESLVRIRRVLGEDPRGMRMLT